MKKISVFTGLLFALVVSACYAETNLLENGNFEVVDTSKTVSVQIRNPELIKKLNAANLPTNTPAIKNLQLVAFTMPAKVSLDKDVKVSGNQSVRIDCSKEDGGSICLLMSMPAKPMQLYKITLWIKTTPGAGGSMRIWTCGKCIADTKFVKLDGEKKNGFTKVEYVFSSKENANILDFYIVAGGGGSEFASVWYDDIEVVETTSDSN
jgi:hypothetical protein